MILCLSRGVLRCCWLLLCVVLLICRVATFCVDICAHEQCCTTIIGPYTIQVIISNAATTNLDKRNRFPVHYYYLSKHMIQNTHLFFFLWYIIIMPSLFPNKKQEFHECCRFYLSWSRETSPSNTLKSLGSRTKIWVTVRGLPSLSFDCL